MSNPAYNMPISPRAPIRLTADEQAAGITSNLKVAAHRFMCPNCAREFSLFQSRAVACKFCPKASQNCPNVRCPHCDSEFPIKGFIVPDKQDAVRMNTYTDKIFDKYEDTYNRR